MGNTDIFPIREKVENRSASTGTNDLKFPANPVPAGRLYVLQKVTFENETHNFTYLRSIVARGPREYPLEEQKSPTLGTLYWMEDAVFLSEGEQLIGRFAGCTAADVITMYVHGYWKLNKGKT